MPIFIMKSSKASPQKALDYILKEEKSVKSDFVNMFPPEVASYSKQFHDAFIVHNKSYKVTSRKYYHAKLSLDPKDGASFAELVAFFQAIIERFFEGHQAVISVHTDTDVTHAHAIINAVNMQTGKKLRLENKDYRNIQSEVQEMARERGYSPMYWEEHKGKTTWKDRLKAEVETALKQSQSEEEFVRRISAAQISIRQTKNNISFCDDKKHRPVRSQKLLGADFTWEHIRQLLEENRRKEQRRKARGHDER